METKGVRRLFTAASVLEWMHDNRIRGMFITGPEPGRLRFVVRPRELDRVQALVDIARYESFPVGITVEVRGTLWFWECLFKRYKFIDLMKHD
jgi:hypothetical protein